VVLVYRSKNLPHFAFPREDVTVDAEDEPAAPGYVTVPWHAVDAWFEEDDEVFVHPRDPYHRIDTAATSRRIRVSIDGAELARSTRAIALYESGLPVRYYLPTDDVRMDQLTESDTVTQC